jgi:hypothetical protein
LQRVRSNTPCQFTSLDTRGSTLGEGTRLPVSPNKIYYLRAPFRFEGTIDPVGFDVD